MTVIAPSNVTTNVLQMDIVYRKHGCIARLTKPEHPQFRFLYVGDPTSEVIECLHRSPELSRNDDMANSVHIDSVQQLNTSILLVQHDGKNTIDKILH